MKIQAVALFLALAQPSTVQYFRNGSGLMRNAAQWEKYSRGEQPDSLDAISYFQGYVAGVLDGERSRLRTPEGFTVDQACAIVAKFIRDNPQRLNEPGAQLVKEAVLKAYSGRR